VNLLENKLVLITPKNSTLGIKSFNDLANANVKKIAIGDPASVPAGQYAQQVFTSLKITDKVKSKLNQGTDVRQVLTWVESGNVDCGIVYLTDAKTSTNVAVVCEAPAGSCSKVVYPVAVLKTSKQAAAAESFIKYMQTSEIATLFKNYGFTVTK
jgi:molybdate transport system substrate-binding protein